MRCENCRYEIFSANRCPKCGWQRTASIVTTPVSTPIISVQLPTPTVIVPPKVVIPPPLTIPPNLTYPHDRVIVALDTETTGLSSKNCRIVELAATRWINGEEVGTYNRLVNPGMPIPPDTSQVNGIYDYMVAGHPLIHELLPDFLDFCAGDLIIAHNAKFDLAFLREECKRNSFAKLPFPVVVCTYQYAKSVFPYCENHKLATMKRYLKITGPQTHRALDDARDCMMVFHHCYLKNKDYSDFNVCKVNTKKGNKTKKAGHAAT